MHQERHRQLASCNLCMSHYPFAYTKLAFELLKFLPEVTLGEKLKRPATYQELLLRELFHKYNSIFSRNPVI